MAGCSMQDISKPDTTWFDFICDASCQNSLVPGMVLAWNEARTVNRLDLLQHAWCMLA